MTDAIQNLLAAVSATEDDIEDQADGNYSYDEIGNLVKDEKEEIAQITWNVSGKITNITRKQGSTKQDLAFTYNAMGQRVTKTVYSKDATGTINATSTTYYVLDATGNPMANYTYSSDKIADGIVLNEQNLYGSSRLGTYKANEKFYELTDHLGNIRTIVTNNNKVENAIDYYPFGMVAKELPSTKNYERSYNGQYREDDLNPSITSAEYWMYDGRLGRRWNVDPVVKAWESVFACLGNNPINLTDIKGDNAEKKKEKLQEKYLKFEKKIENVNKEVSKLIAGGKSADEIKTFINQQLIPLSKEADKLNKQYDRLYKNSKQTTTNNARKNAVNPFEGGLVSGNANTFFEQNSQQVKAEEHGPNTPVTNYFSGFINSQTGTFTPIENLNARAQIVFSLLSYSLAPVDGANPNPDITFGTGTLVTTLTTANWVTRNVLESSKKSFQNTAAYAPGMNAVNALGADASGNQAATFLQFNSGNGTYNYNQNLFLIIFQPITLRHSFR